jgi:hypothetical protein
MKKLTDRELMLLRRASTQGGTRYGIGSARKDSKPVTRVVLKCLEDKKPKPR